MRRDMVRACLGLLLAVAVLVYVGCSSSSQPGASSPAPAAPAGEVKAAPRAAADKSAKLLADWPKPQALLIITGQMDGYLEPCGCTQGQQGGLIRRLDLVERLKTQNYDFGLIDLGSLIKDPAAARGGFEQAKIKFGIALKAYSTLKYDAIGLSAEDLKVGIGEAFAQFLNGLGDETKIVVANVQPGAGFESRIQPSQVIQAGSAKIGVTSVIDPDALAQLSDPDKGDLLPTIKRPDEVLGQTLSELEGKSDHQVLMVQGPPDLAKRLATAYPGFEVVVATSQFADPMDREPLSLNGGKTLLVNVGRRGKYVGAVGFFPGDAEPVRFHLLALGTRYDGPGTAVKKVIEDEYRSMLKAAGVVENFPKHDFAGGASGATFVGAETCKRCHPNTFMKWSTTKHSQAFTALVNDPKPNAIHDAECITCHTTGFEYTSGYRSEAATPQLKGNQCENCHGPGGKHVTDPDNLAFRAPMKISAEQADKNRLCLRCHDEDNDPNFDFAKYWGQVVHKGLDEYKDPKVHQGITPKVARTAPRPKSDVSQGTDTRP
ncbi:MAG: multiheme c-type cytochrome [Isosphaeraceae bacterium]